MTGGGLQLILPVLVLAGGGLVVLALGRSLPADRGGTLAGLLALGVLVAAGAALAGLAGSPLLSGPDGGWHVARGLQSSVHVDALGVLAGGLLLLALGLVLLMGPGLIDCRAVSAGGMRHAAFDGLVLLAGAGLLTLVTSQHLAVLFCALELVAICTHALTGLAREDRSAGAAAVKSVVIGGLGSAFVLYGVALTYGATGSLQLDLAAAPDPPLLLAALGFLAVGLGLKLGAIPFHGWVADVYDGAPTAVAALLASAVKIGLLVLLIRLGLGVFAGLAVDVGLPLIWAVAAATMLYGALVGLVQRRLKRLLAHACLAQTGVLLVGVATAVVDPRAGFAALLFGGVATTLASAGAFACLAVLERDDEPVETLADLRGLAHRRPWTAFALAVFSLSLAGAPPTAGFVGRLLILGAAVDAGLVGLAVVTALAWLVMLHGGLRVVAALILHPAEDDVAGDGQTWGLRWAIGLALAGVLGLGLLPGALHAVVLGAAEQLAAG